MLNFTNKGTFKLASFRGPTKKQIEEAQAILEKVKESEFKQKQNTLIQCECGNTQKVKDSVFYQTHWYTPPCGCSGGDYWNLGEGRVICSSCGLMIRLNFACEELQNYDWKKAFEKVEDVYE